MTINEMFSRFVGSGLESDKIELVKAISENNANAKATFCRGMIETGEGGLFRVFIESERAYTGFKLEKQDGNYTLVSNAVIPVSLFDYASESMVNADFKRMTKKYSPVVKKANEFLQGLTQDTTETTVSIKELKSLLDDMYISFGFVGHVTSKHVRVYFIDSAKAKMKACELKAVTLHNVVDILEKIEHDCVHKMAKTQEETK